MTDKDLSRPEDADVVNAYDFAMAVQPLMEGHTDFVVACAFGWLIGQMVKNDEQLDDCIEHFKGAAQASLWGREDNGLV